MEAVVNKPSLNRVDPFFLQVTIALIVVGITFVISASWHESVRYFGSPWVFIVKHIVSVFFGLSIMFVFSFLHFRWLKKLAWPLLIAALIALALTAKFGVVTGGSRRWLALGFLNLQVSEFAKIITALVVTKVLVEGRNYVWAFLGVLLMAGLVLKQPDLGGSILIMSAAFAAVYASGFNLFAFIAGLGTCAFLGVRQVLNTPYQMDRVKYWLDPYSDPLGHGYNLIQSIRAIGAGGLWGVGIGASVQKLGPLPIAYADFIFSIICEEIGFLGAAGLLFLFFSWLYRAFYISLNAEDKFGQIFGFSLTLIFGFQVLINIAVATGLFPITGMTLPLISFGGSSFLSASIIVGILLNISRFSRI
ncbi:MAG: putative peptidoglycan glycosyltransferase FtsW [Cyanobacteria bacterium]|nr:putative peptidoglycan glycosyltransferase FtsW [Cyanobacteriota bacterium]MDA1021076.1 putative peptidoglycan glycosyltransferase FtsW [Cyanobacteriota bacterium]